MKCALLLLFTVMLLWACNRPTASLQDREKIVALFNKLQKQRWKNYDSLGIYADSLYKLTRGKGGDLEAMAEFGYANYNQKKGNFDKAFIHLHRADSFLNNGGSDSLKAKVQNLSGVMERHLGNYDVSLTHYLKALRYYEKMNYKDGIGGLNNNIAQLYQQKENYTAALQHANVALRLFKDNPTHIVYLLAAQNKASTYLLLNRPDSALTLDSIGIAISRQINNPVILSTFLNNKAKSFAQKKMYDSAKIYYHESFVLDSTHGDKQFIADTYMQLADMAMKQNENEKAAAYLQQSQRLGNETKHKKTLLETWELLSQLYNATGQYKLALQAKDSAQYWKDISINEKTEQRLAELNTQYETEKKIDQIALQQSQLSRQRIIIIAIVAIALLLIALAIAQWRKAELKRQKVLQQIAFEEQQHIAAAVIKAEEKERGRIAADLHDGVGQIMTAAWLNLEAMNNEAQPGNPQYKEILSKTLLLVDDSCKEIRQVSHELMPVSLQKKGLIAALEEYIQRIKNNKLNIELTADANLQPLSNEESLMLFRVIQECIQNVTKHAAATRLDISFSADDTGVDILLEDDGKGFDINDKLANGGIGLQSIISRIQYIKGTVEWDTAAGKGTLVIIHLPR